jgi:hypothetical protein
LNFKTIALKWPHIRAKDCIYKISGSAPLDFSTTHTQCTNTRTDRQTLCFINVEIECEEENSKGISYIELMKVCLQLC